MTLRTMVIPLPPLKHWLAPDILKALAAYSKICLNFRPDLIYANGSRAAVYGGITGRILQIPVIWHCRIATPDIYLDFILSILMNRIIANSQASARRFSSVFRRKVRVVHNGIDLEWMKNPSVVKLDMVPTHWKVVLNVGRVSASKRHDLLLGAFDRIAHVMPNAHLVLVGSPDALEPARWNYLQRLSRRSVFSDRIHWIGHVEDVRPWYRAASVFIMASENEAFGRVLVEAMACGVPVVAVRSGGVPEIVRDGQDGFLVTTGDVAGIADAALEIIEDDGLRSRLSVSALDRAECFRMTEYVQGVLRVFDEILKN